MNDASTDLGELFIEAAQSARKTYSITAPDLSLLFARYCLENYSFSKSQLFQDLLVTFILDGKKNGFFVEFGATNGIELSNTFLLEKNFGWTGILAEPAKFWHSDLEASRDAKIDFRCVWSESGKQLLFSEANERELSTIQSFVNADQHSEARKGSNEYSVDTISLNDLLAFHQAPLNIDYISVDTEGSEFDILKEFDFKKYDVTLFTIEHNFTNQRANIFSLMEANGYSRIFERFSKWDDWYLKLG